MSQFETANIRGASQSASGSSIRPNEAVLRASCLLPSEARCARVGYKASEEVIVLDEMPPNAAGKVDRVRLKRMAEKEFVTAAPGGR